MKKSNFRTWVGNIWRENQTECILWKENPPSLDAYFQKYKWWLKREYKFQRGRNI